MSDGRDNKSSNKHRSWLERFIALLAREPKNREQLTEILRDAEERHVLSADILGMIERIFLVSEMQVREVMVPKSQMVVVRKDSKLEKLLPIVVESGHSRFPVVDALGKDVIGMLLAKDLLKYGFLQNSQPFLLSDIIRPVVFVPENKRLDILLREFRINRNHIAIVIDEYGLVVGLVTIEDVLEQIVGEIEDEYDIDEEDGHIKKLDDGTCIVKASTSVKEFNEFFNSDFNHKEHGAIGGIVQQHFGHLPHRGETIKIQNFRFKVLHSDNKRIYLLEVKITKSKKRE